MPLIKVNSLYKKVEDNINDLEKLYGLLGLGEPDASNVNKCDIFNDNSCVAYYPLNGNTNDVCGMYNGTAHGGVSYGQGFFGEGLIFDDSSSAQYVSVPEILGTENGFTYSCWIDGDTGDKNGTYAYIVNNSKDNHIYSLILTFSNDNDPNKVQIYINGNTSKYRIPIGRTLDPTDKLFLVFSWFKDYNGGIPQLYLKNITKNYEITIQSPQSKYTNSLPKGIDNIVGIPTGYKNRRKLLINHIRIFNRVLTEDEIQQLYKENSVNNEVKEEVLNLDIDIYYPEITDIDISKSSDNDNLNKNKCDIFNDNSSIAFYPLENNSNDLCGNYNGEWIGNEQYENGAAKFDNKSYINISNTGLTKELDSNDVFTISVWGKPEYTKGDKEIISIDADKFRISPQLDRNGILINYHYHKDYIYKVNDIDWKNTFCHYCVIVDKKNKTGKFYLNGKLIGNEKNIPVKIFKNDVVFIGAETGSNNNVIDHFLGLIKKLRIFNRALSENEIKTLYNKEKQNEENIKNNIDLNVTFDNLTKKHFDGDNKDYMVGNGTITFKTNCKKYDLEFLTGSFASVDSDSKKNSVNNDYIEIIINNKNAILEVQNTNDKNYDIKSNDTGYKIDLEEVKKYNSNLQGQSSVFKITRIFKIKIYDLDTNEVKVLFHTDESFSNEAIGYQIKSGKINCNGVGINSTGSEKTDNTEKIENTDKNIKKFNCNLEKVLHIIISDANVNVKGL